MAHARIYSTPAPQGKVGSLSSTVIRANQRLTLSAASATLAALSTGAAVPLYRNDATNPGHYPIGVELQVEVADAALLVYVTTDGGTASATLGMQVPIGPNPPMLIMVDGGKLGTAVSLYSTGAAHVQARFLFED